MYLGIVTADTKLSIDWVVGQIVIVYIKDGSWVESSPCPDKICIKEGRIQKPGETIACVPEKVLLTLQSAAKEREHDAILR